MVDDSLTFGLNVETDADKAAKGFKLLSDHIDDVTASASASAPEIRKMEKALLGAESAFGKAPASVKKYSDSFSTLRKEVSAATKAIQDAAQDYVGGGGTDVLGAAAQGMDLETAKKYLAIKEAEGITAERVAGEVEAADKRKEASARRQFEIYNDYLEHQYKSESNAAKKKAAFAEQQDAIYNNYLEHQYRADQAAAQRKEKVAADQNKVYNDYLEHQYRADEVAAKKKARIAAEQDKTYNSYMERQFAADQRRDLQIKKSEEELSSLRKSSAIAEKALTDVGRDRLTVAKENLEFARKERAAAGRGVASASGGDLSSQVSAQKEYLRATNNLTKATREFNRASQDGAANLPTLRYAMYDVARTAGIMSAAIAGAGAGLLAASASYETSFTAVERTSGVTGTAVGDLRDDLLGLARVIPQSFGEISDLAARGAQLGVASDNLAGFTETVAQFVATSDTVTLDQAVEAFGRISNLTGDSNFNALGSAITLVGVNAAATEGQIVKTTQELAPFAASAGIASHEVVGLATAVASLGQPPERARSAFLSLQATMDGALAGTNDKLNVFADLLGMTAEETAKLWKNDPSQFISSFAAALGSVENMTGALSDLGLSEKRASQVFQALAADSRNAGDGLSVLDQALTDSEKGYKDGTELARQYGLIVDDLSSKWQLFLNSAMELASALGDNLAPAAKAALDMITPFIQRLSDMARSPIAKVVTVITAALVALGGTLLGGIALWAASKAAIAGAQTALAQLGATGATTTVTLRGLSASLTQTAVAAGVSSRAINVFKATLASTGIGLAVVALGTLATAFMQTGATAEETFNKYLGSAGGLSEALAADLQGYQTAMAEGNSEALQSYTELSTSTEAATTNSEGLAQAYKDAASVLGADLPSAVNSGTEAVQNQTAVLGDNTLAWMRNSLLQSEAFNELFQDGSFRETWETIGADFNDVMRIAATQGEQGVIDYFNALAAATEGGGGAYLQGLALFHNRILESYSRIWGSVKGFFSDLFSGDFSRAGGQLLNGLAGLKDTWSRDFLSKPLLEVSKLTAGMGAVANATGGFGKVAQDTSEDTDQLSDSLDDAGNSAGDAAQKIRTLKDYASDLKQVWDRAFEIRFSGQQTIDAVRDSIQKLRDAAEASAKKVADLRNTIRSLSADAQALRSDISILEYYLRIANEYGDTKRATAIEAELAKKRAELAAKTTELADKNKELKKEQDSQNKTLVGNSQAARDNRKSIQDLVQQYQAHIGALAASGMSQDELSRATQKLKQDFIQQATQLGYNRKEIQLYARAFDDVAIAIARVPRNITITANANPAIQAFAEFAAKASSSLNKVNSGLGTVNRGFNSLGGAASRVEGDVLRAKLAMERANLKAGYMVKSSSAMVAASLERDPFKKTAHLANAAMWAKLASQYYSGGFTGRGGKYEPKGIVHGGEYVFRKDQVDQSTGLPTQAALMSMMPTGSLPSRTVAPSTAGAGGGAAMVSLTPATIQAIAQALPTGVILDGNIVGEVSSREYARSNAQGSY